MSSIVVEDPRSLHQACERWRAQGARIGLVPTMGALHAGHVSLLDCVRRRGADRLVLSVFVNPLQFGPSEDLARYPRTFAEDLEVCREHGVDAVYAPHARVMYPDGFQTYIEVEQLTRGDEGSARPTHFRGVTTVVAKLLHAVGPCVAAFGRKDYQQWRVVERMVRDLDMPVEVVGCPTLREPDGLALSSRNRYLTTEERPRASALYRGLRAADVAFRAGKREIAALSELVRAPIAEQFDSVEYIRFADAASLSPISSPTATGSVVVLVAARIGATRLIDNAVLGEDILY